MTEQERVLSSFWKAGATTRGINPYGIGAYRRSQRPTNKFLKDHEMTDESETATSFLNYRQTKKLSPQHFNIYSSWLLLRGDIENQLVEIERAMAGDATQIDTSTESIREAVDNLCELVPEIKQIAKALEDQEWQQTLETLPR